MVLKGEGTDNAGLVIDIWMTRRHYNFEKVTKFVYLGVTISSYNDKEGEINNRLLRGNGASGNLLNISNIVSRK